MPNETPPAGIICPPDLENEIDNQLFDLTAQALKPAVQRQTKQVLVVRKDLRMRMGKVGAQCAHASMKVLLDQMRKNQLHWTQQEWVLTIDNDTALEYWLTGAFTKICVFVNSAEELDAVYQKAQDAGLPSSMIIDSGLTEFHGQPTKTVVAIGPAWGDEIDQITGSLPLL